jgi:hypothetical protein
MTAIFDLGEDSYVQAVWFCAWHDTDWMAVLFRDGDGPWRLRYRFRYYGANHDAWDSDDTKSVYEFRAKPDVDQARAMAAVEQSTDELMALMKAGRHGVRTADKLLIRGGVGTLVAAMKHQSWAHFKEVGAP